MTYTKELIAFKLEGSALSWEGYLLVLLGIVFVRLAVEKVPEQKGG